MKLLIFDIDGTLTHLDGATRHAFNAAFETAFQTTAKIADIPMHGRTDPVIFRDCYRATGLEGEWQFAYQQFQPHYLQALPTCIQNSSGKKVLPGIPELLNKLSKEPQKFALALGTGNMEAGARLKVGCFGLNHFFPVGGFGDHFEVRADIMRDAVKKSETHYARKFHPESVWVIGDTIHDIAGGQAIGAKTIGVATGGAFSAGDLRAANPTVVLDDLSDTERVVNSFQL